MENTTCHGRGPMFRCPLSGESPAAGARPRAYFLGNSPQLPSYDLPSPIGPGRQIYKHNVTMTMIYNDNHTVPPSIFQKPSLGHD